MTALKAGDVVKLKSSSPKMTIRFVEGNEAYCEWFAGAEAKGARFTLAQLVEFKPASPEAMSRIVRSLA
jgi:uncharacterized protein YodC (DUF2158 family)